MSTIGRLNCRVTVQRWNQTIDDAGGNVAVLSDSWVKWARVEDRSGSVQLSNEQRSWSYDYKLTLRYEISRKTNSNDTILYKTKKLQINSLSIENEGDERFEVLRCSLIEDLAAVSPIPPPPNPPDPSGPYFTLQYQGTLNIQNSFFAFDGYATLDWGDGSDAVYLQNSVVEKSLGYNPYTITFYHHNSAKDIGGFVNNYSSFFYSMTGTLPNQVTRIQFSKCGISEFLPLPVTLKFLYLQYNNLTVAELDRILNELNDNGLTNGELDIRAQFNGNKPTIAGRTIASTLRSKGWIVRID